MTEQHQHGAVRSAAPVMLLKHVLTLGKVHAGVHAAAALVYAAAAVVLQGQGRNLQF